MQLIELIAWKCNMHRVVLTVFKSNAAAMSFYKNTMKYIVDADADPNPHGLDKDQKLDDDDLQEDAEDGGDTASEGYEILCKQNPKRAAATSKT